MNRDAFLQRVRDAAATGRAHRVQAELRAFGEYAPATRDALYDRLAAEVAAVGGTFHRPNDRAGLAALIRQLADQFGCRSALVWKHESLVRLGVYEALDTLGVERFDADCAAALEPSAQRQAMLRATLGITAVDAAIAETGSIAVHARFGQERSASLLPVIHLAIVEARLVLPDLFDYFARLAPDSLPSNITLITGPSKTGDLELRLVTGVHGPRHWHVALVDF